MPPARLVLGNECCHLVKDGKRQGQQALGFGAWFTLSSLFSPYCFQPRMTEEEVPVIEIFTEKKSITKNSKP